MQTQKVIEQLGYSANEAKVYLALLELGESIVSELAERLGLPRSSVQVIVERLQNDGLLSSYAKGRHKYWMAEEPARLLEHLRQREELVREALPKLQSMQSNRLLGRPAVKVHVGHDAIRHLFDDIIESRSADVLAIVPEEDFVEVHGTAIAAAYIKERVRRNVHTRMLVPDTPAGRRLKEAGAKELRNVRFLPDDIRIPTGSYVYGERVAFLMLNRAQPTVVLIHDADIAQTKSVTFEVLWNRSSLQ